MWKGGMTTKSRFHMGRKKTYTETSEVGKNPTQDNQLITQFNNWGYEKNFIPKLCNGKLNLQWMNIFYLCNQKSTLYPNATVSFSWKKLYSPLNWISNQCVFPAYFISLLEKQKQKLCDFNSQLHLLLLLLLKTFTCRPITFCTQFPYLANKSTLHFCEAVSEHIADTQGGYEK